MNFQMKSNSLKQILSLEKFKLEPDEMIEVYPRAYALPEFFSHNLVSDERVVKYFEGPYALVGAFYYQLMKLSLEIEAENVNYRELIFKKFVKFDLFGQGELEDEIFTDFQYRKFMKDFIEKVENEDVPNFERTVDKYPVIDEILIKIFKIILPFPLLMELEDNTEKPVDIARNILTFLCHEFQITLTEIGQCFKFQESDTFLYVDNVKEAFLAFNECYLEEKQENSQFKSSFECGQDNSFLTKYQTQSGHHRHIDNTNTAKDLKLSEDSDRMWIQTKEDIVKLPNSAENFHRNKVEDLKLDKLDVRTNCDSSRPDNLQTSQSSVSQPFKSLSSFFNKGKVEPVSCTKPVDLYGQFTDSIILKQMSSLYRKGVRQIKEKYRGGNKRASIRGFI